jgi:hypothetical protein
MDDPSKVQHQRVMYAVASVLGKESTLQTCSGEECTGRLYTYTSEGLVLSGFFDTLQETTTRAFPKGSFESLSFYNVTPLNYRKFKTDTEISNTVGGTPSSTNPTSGSFNRMNRSLEKWEGEGEGELLKMDEGFAGYDQFKVNEQKFGVTTNYQDEFYTTPKVSERELTKDQLSRAEKAEREILSKAKTDEVIDDNEEAAFSAVLGVGRFANMKPKLPSHSEAKRRVKTKGREREEVKRGGVDEILSFVPEVKRVVLDEVPSFVPGVKEVLAPLSAELPLDSVTAQYLEGAAYFTDTKLSPFDWDSDLVA